METYKCEISGKMYCFVKSGRIMKSVKVSFDMSIVVRVLLIGEFDFSCVFTKWTSSVAYV